MHKLPEFAVQNRVVVVTIVVLMVLWGTFSFFNMPRREDPEFTIMSCVVTTEWPGASVDKVEELITDPLEEILDGLEEVETIRSTSINGLSTIFLDLYDNTPPGEVDQVWDKVRARVRNIEMPDDSISPVVTDDFGDTSVILFAVYQKPMEGQTKVDPQYAYSHRELDIYSERVRDGLRLLPGVAKAQRFGVRQEAIYIETDSGNWSQNSLTVNSLQQLVESRNVVGEGSTLETLDGRFLIKPDAELDALNEINQVLAAAPLSGGNSNQVKLRDIGLNVRRAYEEPPGLLCRFGDAESSFTAIIVSVTMKSGSNIIDICEMAKQRIADLQGPEQKLPPDIAVVPVSDQSESVQARIQEVIVNVLQAVAIVVVVVYLVVGFRTAAVMAANIPFVLLISVGIIPFFGVQLEQMSLASMIIALGLLVDNAVQVCDQSRTNQINGMNPVEATVEGAKTLAAPMLNGTLTTIAAFVPMVIAFEGGNREFIYSLPVTLSTMLGVSWILAMTFCVILAATFIRPPQKDARTKSPLLRLIHILTRRSPSKASEEHQISRANSATGFYQRLIQMALRHKFVTLAGTFLILVLATRLPVRTEFFPQGDRDQFVVELWLPENVSIEQTNQTARKLEQLIQQLSPVEDETGETVQRIRSMRTLVGGGGSRWYLSWDPEPRKPNYAEILVRTSDVKFTHEFAEQIRHVARRGDEILGIKPIPGARIVPVELMLGPPAEPVVLRIMGPGFADHAQLREVAADVKQLIAEHPGSWNTHDSWGVDGYEVQLAVDAEKANLAGVSNAQIADTVAAYYSGLKLTTFREGDHSVPVYFRLAPEGRRSVASLDQVFVEGSAGKVPLQAVAEIDPTWKPAVIERRNLNRTIEVRSRVEPGVSGNDIVAKVMASEEMAEIQDNLPVGYQIEIGGALEESQKGGVKMMQSFAISFIAVILLLVIQFNSLSKTIIIITTLPLSLIGVLLGLWITDSSLGFMPQLGILSLFGIVLNTAIIFMEFADIVLKKRSAQSQGTGGIAGLTKEEFRDCLAEAGQQRLLPIFLTTATTVGGLLPLALSGGPLWVGMAWLMVFGLTVATLLTLFVIPALYALIVEHMGIQPVNQ